MSKQRGSARRFKLYPPLSGDEFQHISENIRAFCEAWDWVRNYLAQPHPDLGRTGTVCPFAQSALDFDTLRMAVVRLPDDNKRDAIIKALNYYLEAFLSIRGAGHEQTLQAAVLLFPDVSPDEAPELIDNTKEQLKSSFVQQGLMLGEFHPRNGSPGLHNARFTPLRSPIPMLAIRRIVSTDVAFLNRPEYDAATRLKYMQAYLAVPGLSEGSRREVEFAVDSITAEMRNHASKG